MNGEGLEARDLRKGKGKIHPRGDRGVKQREESICGIDEGVCKEYRLTPQYSTCTYTQSPYVGRKGGFHS